MDEKKALAVIEQYKNDLVYVKAEDLQTQKMFVPQVTVLHALREDFHEYPINGKLMPKAHHVDRIGEAAGVTFIAEQCGTRKEGDNTYVGWAQGKKRMPDGTYRTSSKQEYEFDVDVRAQETFTKDTKGKYNNERDKQLYFIDLKKVARQRASTGARLRVIRELVGIPIAFEPAQIQKAMVVYRIAINTDELLANPETRQMAVEAAMNGTTSIYGPKDVTPMQEALPEPEAEPEAIAENDDFATFDQPEPVKQEDERRNLRIQLEDWLLAEPVASSKDAAGLIRELIADENATIEDMQALIDRCKKYAESKSGKVAS